MSNQKSPVLTLLAGPAGSGKTEVCFSEFRRHLRASTGFLGDRYLLILPTAEHRQRAIDLLMRKDIKGFFGRHVTTFGEALQSFLKVGDIHFASGVMRRMILKDIISRFPFNYFKSVAGTTGFVELASRWAAELKESLVTPKDFRNDCACLEKVFPESAEKYRELADFYSAYESELVKAGLKDRHDALFLLEEGLKRGDWSLPRLKHVWIDGFFDFSPLQLSFIRFLAGQVNAVTVTLTMDMPPVRPSLFFVPFETKRFLEQIGFKTRNLPPRNYRTKHKALAYVERRLFREKLVKMRSASNAVRILEAAGLTSEIEMAAREIKRFILTGRFHFSDIALIFRRVGPYVSMIRSVFSKFEIPVHIHEREELRLNPRARTLISLFRIFLEGWKREDLINFLKSGYVDTDDAAVCAMDLAAVRKGVYEGRDHWLQNFNLPVLKNLADLEEQFIKTGTLSGLISLTLSAMNRFGLSTIPENPNRKNKLDYAALKRLYLLLDEIRRKFSGNTLTFEQFSQTFIYLIEVDLFSLHDRELNQVQVYNVSLARQKEYKIVFLAGLLEKQFPVQVREDPILRDEERRVINRSAGRVILKEYLPRQSIERLFFYFGVTRAREKLILSYPGVDLEGNESLPSFYVDEVRSLFKEKVLTKKQRIRDVFPGAAECAREQEAAANVIWSFWQHGESSQPVRSGTFLRKTGQLPAFFYNHFCASPSFRRLIQALLLPIEGKISDERVKPYFRPKNDTFSPTRLSEYAECPYRYFANELLMLQNDEEAIDMRTVGQILHHVLEQFHIWAKGKGIENISLEEARYVCERYVEAALAAYPLSGDRWYKIELKKRDIEMMIDRILVQEVKKRKPPLPGLVPAYFEYAFGFEPENNFLIFQTDEGEIRLRGKIDRIDTDAGGRFGLVIDYKTGKKFERASLEKGIQLQLPLYLLAMTKHLKLRPLGAHLYSLSAVKSSGFHNRRNAEEAGLQIGKRPAFSEEEWSRLFEDIRTFISKFVRGIRNAQIPVRPRECVSYCPFSGVCRIEKWRLPAISKEIKEEDRRFKKEKAGVGV